MAARTAERWLVSQPSDADLASMIKHCGKVTGRDYPVDGNG
jgi:hypothetical protein